MAATGLRLYSQRDMTEFAPVRATARGSASAGSAVLLLVLAGCTSDATDAGASGAGGETGAGGSGVGAAEGSGAGPVEATHCDPGSRVGDPAGSASFATPAGTTVIVRTPAGYNPLVASPLLVMYSGATFDAAMTESDTGLTGPATEGGYVVAYIDHLVPDADANIQEAADAVASIEGAWCVDPERVYLSGHSDGGSMTHLVVLRGWVDAAAIAPSASGLRADSLREVSCVSRALPVLELHSKDDEMFPVTEGYGGDVAKWFATCSQCGAPSAADAEGCVVYSECSAGGDVEYCEGTGEHGSWPPQRNQQILDFFARF